jgi:hypothetical protein
MNAKCGVAVVVYYKIYLMLIVGLLLVFILIVVRSVFFIIIVVVVVRHFRVEFFRIIVIRVTLEEIYIKVHHSVSHSSHDQSKISAK